MSEGGYQAQLQALSRALQEVHRTLIDHARKEYESEKGRVESSGELLHLVLNDETFAWLRPLSGLIVEVDELAARDPEVTEAEAGLMRARIEKLIVRRDPRGFGHRYVELLSFDPKVAMNHFTMRMALDALPRP